MPRADKGRADTPAGALPCSPMAGSEVNAFEGLAI